MFALFFLSQGWIGNTAVVPGEVLEFLHCSPCSQRVSANFQTWGGSREALKESSVQTQVIDVALSREQELVPPPYRRDVKSGLVKAGGIGSELCVARLCPSHACRHWTEFLFCAALYHRGEAAAKKTAYRNTCSELWDSGHLNSHTFFIFLLLTCW